MLGDYDLLTNSIPLEDIEKIISFSVFDNETKKRLIAYEIAKRLEGTTIRIPKTAHKVDFAEFLIEFNVDRETVMQKAEIARRTYYKIKAQNNE